MTKIVKKPHEGKEITICVEERKIIDSLFFRGLYIVSGRNGVKFKINNILYQLAIVF